MAVPKPGSRIGVVGDGNIPSMWAHSMHVMKQAQGFRRLGLRPEVLTIERAEDRRRMRSMREVHELYSVDPEIDVRFFRDRGEDVLRTWFGRLLVGLRKRWPTLMSPYRALGRHCLRQRLPLVWCRSYLGAATTIDLGIPTIVEMHSRNSALPAMQEVLRRAESPSLLRVITITEAVKSCYVDAGFAPEKIRVLPSAVDHEEYAAIRRAESAEGLRRGLDLEPSAPLVVYAGSLQAGRGIDDLLAAAAVLPEVAFVFVGGSSEEVDDWRIAAARAGAANSVFRGFVGKGEVPKYTIAADVLVMPYTRRIGTWRHMSPIKLFEYLASGRPVVATDLPAIRDVLGDTGDHGTLVPERDPAALARAIRHWLSDGARARRVGERNHEHSRRYSYLNRARRILEDEG